MEPDILATPSEAASSVDWIAPAVEPVHPVVAEVHANGASLAPSPTPVVRVNGNGHHPAHAVAHGNGNGNGNGLAYVTRGANGARPTNGAAHAPVREMSGGPYQRILSGATLNVDEVMAAFDARPEQSTYLRFGKRLLDLAGSSIALLLSMPVLAVAALAIKLESRGPVFYRSTRIGRGGRPFTFLKLRSMVRDAEHHRHRLTHLNECDGPVFKISRDPRMTRVGRFLRTTSLDEVPQFINVLMGDMSLVGPRPPIPEEVAQYEPWQLRRLDVRPGITCLWQISGRSRIGFQEWMRLDLEYIRHQSFWFDLKILLRTIPAVLSREGAY
jgi:lipopolysaccharide/colanic/teichoic acid biosynthesis glycosyltransferase